MPYDAELTELRARVDCRVVLERAGWQLDRQESSRRSAKYRRHEGEIIVVTHDGKGWFDPLGEAARGDVIALAQRLWGGTLGHARKALRPLAGIPPTLPLTSEGGSQQPTDPQQTWRRRRPPRPGSAAWRYLTEARALPPDLLARLSDQGAIREGFGGTTWFLHRAAGQGIGWEMRGPAYKGFSAGGSKTLFVFVEAGPVTRVMVCEGAIDALSLAVLDGYAATTAYVSTGGGWGDAGREALLGLTRGGTRLAAATDRGLAGEKLAHRLEQLAREAGVPFERRVPTADDWNDQLVAMRDAELPSPSPARLS